MNRPQVESTAILDKRNKVASEKVLHDLIVLHDELSTLRPLEMPEVEWSRIRTIEFQDMIKQRYTLSDRLVRLTCQNCPDFDDHVSEMFWRVETC
jgi:antiviral helicase SKI2